jgi:polysaccharide export outer membrane protein
MRKTITLLWLLLTLLPAPLNAQQRIQPGDILELTCAEEPALNGEYTVNPNGFILLQFIGAVEVKGLSPDEAARKIADTLVRQQILRRATIKVKLKGDILPPMQPPPVVISGAVSLPGEVPWKEGLRLAEALSAAKPSVVADLKRIRITRSDGTVESVDFSQYVEGTNQANPLLLPGDAVFVPVQMAALDVTVLGAVVRPGVVPFKEGMTIRDAIAAAGGTRADADTRGATVRLAAGGEIRVDLSSAEASRRLAPGDHIIVPLKPATHFIFIRGAVARPGTMPWEPGMTLSIALRDAAPIRDAPLNRVRIQRTDEQGKIKVLNVNFNRIANGQASDIELKEGDIIEVPYPVESTQTADLTTIIGIGLLLWLLFGR